MNKSYVIFFIFLWTACNLSNPNPKESSKVKLVFTNQSPYPICKIRVSSSHTSIDPAYYKYVERRTLNRLIMPQNTDTLLLGSFNGLYHSMSVFFLVGKDTVKNTLMASDMPSNYIITSGTRKYGLYYSEGEGVIPLEYTLEVEDLK